MDEQDNEVARARKKLREILSAVGFKHHSGGPGVRQMNFGGRFREWIIVTTLNSAWFHAHTVICTLPSEPGLRSELLLWMARANARLSLLKYSVTQYDHVILEFELRCEKLELEDVANSVWFLQAMAEEDYMALLRVASGDARLDALSQSFAVEPQANQESLSQ
jgi:hypothetical protein